LFPSINIRTSDNYNAGNSLSIGPTSNFANAGIFQNSFQGSTSLNWVHGRNTISTGINWTHYQLNVINRNNKVTRVTFADFLGFLQGQVCGPNTTFCSGQDASEYLSGASNRYYRASQVGTYLQDDIKIKSNLTVDVGVRWDWDGPLSEKNGMLTNFYRKDYSYDIPSDTINNIGLVVAGNNKTFGTKGVSDSTLTGRQWGFAPRIGVVYSPSFLKNFVVRAGYGLYFDRGEFFTEFSPPAGGGVSGPFGVTVSEPFVVPFFAVSGGSFAQPFGTAPPPPPPSNLSSVAALVPNAAQLIANTTPFCNATGQSGCGPLFFGGYDPKNKLPYSANWTLDLQWQPINSVVLSAAYVGNHGFHEVIPIPFNQAQIATPQNPLLKNGPNQQIYSYGYNVPGVAAENISTIVDGFGTGNVALRAPYI
ncbi:MAG: TonB-dependent receptor domain-containing protein, partial [Candidatus Acidiferrales bacterium]